MLLYMVKKIKEQQKGTAMETCDVRVSKAKTTVVIQSYNNDKEDLARLVEFFERRAKAHVVVLEKGALRKSDLPSSVTFHKLGNKGRELGAFLWYVIKYYDTLDGRFIFTSASIAKHRRAEVICDLLSNRRKFQCSTPDVENRSGHYDSTYDFHVDSYEGELHRAVVRPFGKWYETYIGNWDVYRARHSACYNGVFKTHASYLTSRPVRFYRRLARQVNAHNSPEVGHYLERAVSPVFGRNMG